MANLRDIRDRITSIQSTQQITKAMKMVAAAKLRKAQNRIIDLRPYANRLSGVFKTVVSNSSTDNLYFKDTPEHPSKILYLVVSSDRGLCGGFNTNLFKFIELDIKSRFLDQFNSGNVHLYCLGRKSSEYFKKRGYTLVKEKTGFLDKLVFEHPVSIMSEVRSMFEAGEYDLVHISFNEFKSVIAQNRIIDQLLPIQKPNEEDIAVADYLYEPSATIMLERLLPLFLNNQLWKALLESYASEQGARMAAMDNATENAKEITRQLKLRYNQARQAAITTEISEIVSGAEALNG
jgi:F-type H+-transporting ATPase subunit gamma